MGAGAIRKRTSSSFPNEFLMRTERGKIARGIGGEEKEKKFFLLSATVSNRSNYVIAGGGRRGGETTCRAAQY